MRKLGACGLAAGLLVGLGAGVAAAADDDTESAKPAAKAPTWQWKPFGDWFGLNQEKKPVPKKSAATSESTAEKKPKSASKTAAGVEEAAAQRVREENALLRRLQACDKLKEIAIQTNAKDLLHRSEELEERAETVYTQRTAHLRGRGGSVEVDKKTSDPLPGAGKARSADSAAHTVWGNGSRPDVEEVKP